MKKRIFFYNFQCLEICANYGIRLFSAQIKEAVLSGIALEDDKREEFNKIEQVCLDD